MTPTTVTPDSELDRFPVPTLRQRGTGQTEQYLQSALEALRSAILTQYGGYNAQELITDVWLPESYEGIQTWTQCLGASSDTPHPKSTNFVLPDDGSFVMVYGVNHQAAGKASYSAFATYGQKYNNGVVGLTNRTFAGSAADYIPTHPRVNSVYAWKMGRSASSEPHYSQVPFGPSRQGLASTRTINWASSERARTWSRQRRWGRPHGKCSMTAPFSSHRRSSGR